MSDRGAREDPASSAGAATPPDAPVRLALRARAGAPELPRKGRPGDAAVDLPARDAGVIGAGRRGLVPTGFEVAIPVGHAGLVLPRSGLALDHGVTVLNAPGLIDSGYRGELKVILINHGDVDFFYDAGQRIAQLMLVAVVEAEVAAVDVLPPAPDDRGSAGFGSSG